MTDITNTERTKPLSETLTLNKQDGNATTATKIIWLKINYCKESLFFINHRMKSIYSVKEGKFGVAHVPVSKAGVVHKA